MKAIREIFAAFLFAVLMLLPLSPQAADAVDSARAQEVQDAVRASARSLGLQTELPSDQPIRTENRIDPDRSRNLDLSWLRFSGDIATIMLWVAIFIIVVVIVMTLRDNLWSSSRSKHLSREEQAEENAPTATAARMDRAQNEADELARRGSFAEAMHVLLLQSVTELRRRLDVSIAASLTSREILHRIGLPPEGRAVFADIIRRVEISYFGAHQPGEEDYLACRRSFEALTELLRKGSAA